jgi:hypothetical protein
MNLEGEKFKGRAILMFTWIRKFLSKKRAVSTKRVIPAKTEKFFGELCKALESYGKVVNISKNEHAEWVAPWQAQTPEGPGQIRICAYRAGHIEVTILALTLRWRDKYLKIFQEKCPYRVLGPDDLDRADPGETIQRLHKLASEYERVADKIEEIRERTKAETERVAMLEISLLS